jgi:hypothetical protein
LTRSQSFWQCHKLLVAGAFLLLVLIQGLLQFPSTNMGRPYEGWDEVATYNAAYITMGSKADRVYRYGTLDTFMQWAAIKLYEERDTLGRAYSHIRYGNHVPASWNDPAVAFAEKKTWPGADYNYFRGNDDRQPIFLSRQIHFLFVYAVLAGLGLGMIAVSHASSGSLLALAPLLLLIAVPEMQYQASQSLPNAINALLVFGIVLFAMRYAHQQRRHDLTVSLGLLALGMNFKPDIIIAAGAPGLALVLVCLNRGLRQGLRAALRDLLPGVLVGAAIIVATDPGLLRDPLMNLRTKYHVLMGAAGGGNDHGYIGVNWTNFRDFLDSVFLARGWGGVIGPALVALGLLAAFIAAAWKRGGAALAVGIGAVVACVSWGVIVLKAPGASDRYFLNGLAAFLAMAAMTLFLLAETDWRRAARCAAIFVAVICAGHFFLQDKNSLAIARANAATGGFDPAHHRNLASLEAIRLARAPGFHGKILVDQHSYIDLRPFRQNGIDARYVNMDTLAGVMAALDPSQDHLLVFARGTDAIRGNSWRPWMGDWTPQIRARYQDYQARLVALRVLKHYGGTPHEVLSTAPIEPNTELFVSAIGRR